MKYSWCFFIGAHIQLNIFLFYIGENTYDILKYLKIRITYYIFFRVLSSIYKNIAL